MRMGHDWDHPYTELTAWLLRLGIGISHGRAYHPQTQGKEERFHRTLKAEVLRDMSYGDLLQCQQAFDRWRNVYNLERPHQALGMATPASRYQISSRAFPETLPAIEYGPDDQIRKVQEGGFVHFQGRTFRVSRGFKGLPIALRQTSQDGVWNVHFCQQQIHRIDLAALPK